MKKKENGKHNEPINYLMVYQTLLLCIAKVFIRVKDIESISETLEVISLLPILIFMD